VVSTIARTPPPAFLFPNQRCQRPERVSPSPLFIAGGRRRRLSSDRPQWCQSGFFKLLRPSLNPGIRPQKPLRAAEGLPSCVRSDSIEARENTHPQEKIKCLSASSFRSCACAPSRAGGGYLVAVSVGVNRSFGSLSDEARKLRIPPKKPARRALERKLRLRHRAVG